jgi:hypothetical protein
LRNSHAAASRTAEEKESVRMRAHHACHLTLTTGQNTLTAGKRDKSCVSSRIARG